MNNSLKCLAMHSGALSSVCFTKTIDGVGSGRPRRQPRAARAEVVTLRELAVVCPPTLPRWVATSEPRTHNVGANSEERPKRAPRHITGTVMTSLIVAVLILTSFESAAQIQPSPTMTPPPSRPGLALTTAAFDDGGIIPIKYTMAAGADAVSLMLRWTNVPDGTVTFALILRDPDSSVSRSINEIVH